MKGKTYVQDQLYSGQRLSTPELQYLLRSGRRWRGGRRGGRRTAANKELKGPGPATAEPGLRRPQPPRKCHCAYRAELETRPRPAGIVSPF